MELVFGSPLLSLSHLHKYRVVHYNFKPKNFLIENPFTIITANFGISNIITNNLLKTFCGLLKYTTPEIFFSSSHGYGPLVDIWLLGVIILELIYSLLTMPNQKQGLNALQKRNKTQRQLLLDKVFKSDKDYNNSSQYN